MEINFQPSREQINHFVLSHPHGHLLQSYEWGEAQEAFGESVFRVSVMENDTIFGVATVIVKTFYKNFHYLYCPKGPIFAPTASSETQQLLFSAIHEEAKKRGSLFLRVAPEVQEQPEWLAGFQRAEQELEPYETLMLNLHKPEEGLLSEMKSKTRYNIKLAQKKGVAVASGTDKKFMDIFLKLNQETSQRDRFTVHKDSYYLSQLDALGPSGFMKVYVAYAQGAPIAANLVTFFGRRATYMHGASSNEGRNLMPTFALQWEAIKDAKMLGCKEYDFWGITTNEDPKHSWAGITRFKTGFGGTVVKYIGAYDLPYRRALYSLYGVYRKFK